MSEGYAVVKHIQHDIKNIRALGICGCLVMVLLCGCSQKSVDYELDQSDTQETTSGSLSQFADAGQWVADWSVSVGNGKEMRVSVDAKITVPDAESMSVVEVEETALDEAWKEQFMKAFYGENPFYYHNLEDSSNHVVADKLDSCDEYLGNVGELPCIVKFSNGDGENGSRNGMKVEAFPLHTAAFGPETDRNYMEMYRYSQAVDFSENTCSISKEEAKKQADDFLGKIGRTSQVLCDESPAVWIRLTQDETGMGSVSEEVTYGYSFTYGTGVDNMAFSQFGSWDDFGNLWDVFQSEDVYEFADETVITVTDEGVVDVSISSPVTIKRVLPQAELLPLSTIQGILEDEVVNNGVAYSDLENQPSFWALDLIYFRVRDDSQKGCYSYIPTWCFSAKSQDVYYHPVLVNAIDGNVIYIKEVV